MDFKVLKDESQSMKSGMGAVSWAVLEMFKRGGMPDAEVKSLHEKMNRYFPNPTDDDCNAILKAVETRLVEDKAPGKEVWY